MTLSKVELIAKKVLTARTDKTRIKWENKMNELTQNNRMICLAIQQVHETLRLNSIHANSYLTGGDFNPDLT